MVLHIYSASLVYLEITNILQAMKFDCGRLSEKSAEGRHAAGQQLNGFAALDQGSLNVSAVFSLPDYSFSPRVTLVVGRPGSGKTSFYFRYLAAAALAWNDFKLTALNPIVCRNDRPQN